MRNRVLVGTGRAAVACALLALGALPAAAGPGGGADTPLCHYDGQGRVRLIHVNASAVASHVANHGDHGLLWFFADADGDGFGDPAAGVEACEAPAGTVDNNGDCDDADAAVNPGAAEVCADGVDNDCDGEVDEGCVGCADILLHCGPSEVLQTICGPGPHELTGVVRYNASYLAFGADVSGAILTQCGTGAQMSVTSDTNFCDLPGGCCGPGRWNDEVCFIELF